MEPIAIVGMGCLFPGADTPAQYWQNLLAQKDVSSALTEDLIGVDPAYYFAEKAGTIDKIHYHKNGHVRGFDFDASEFQLASQFIGSLDNLFKWTMYAAKAAYNDAHITAREASRCGLLLGNIGMPTHLGKQLSNRLYSQILEPYIQQLLGDDRFSFANYWPAEGISDKNLSTASLNGILAAEALGIKGPSYTLDAACSSAIYAMQLASFYLQTNKADVMLTGAVCHADHIYIDHGFNILQAFPDTGKDSIPFDRNSDGLKAGEGAGVVALKRLRDAVADGNQIYGVIESIGLSNDGGAKHILVPDHEGQMLALQRAYGQNAANEGADVDYLECHATGTPVGDQVELNSVERFFTEHGQLPLIGANKGNIGHMLTASGMASLMKILLAMQHDVIPGTVQLQDMVATKQGKLTADNVVRETTDWPSHQQRGYKRAGINAFGFGGVNGHMVVREFRPGQELVAELSAADQSNSFMPLAVVGMGVGMASTSSISQFNEVLKNSACVADELPPTRWSGLQQRPDLLIPNGLADAPLGAYIEKFDFDCKQFKLPPNVAGMHLLSHMWLMQLAAAAYKDAGFQPGKERRNIAVIVASDNDYLCYRYQARNEAAWQVRDSLQKSGIDLSAEQTATLESIVKDSLFPEPYAEGITGGINNVVASRISASLGLNGPALSIFAQENSVFRAIELAQFLLSLSEVEAVIVGSGSFCGGFENIYHTGQAAPNTGNFSLSFGIDSNGANVGEGGGVVVLRRAQDAERDNAAVYANIDGLAIEHSQQSSNSDFIPQVEEIIATARQAQEQAGVAAADISYVEAHASGYSREDSAEVTALAELYACPARPMTVGSVKANYGHTGSASGMASLLKTCLCLAQGYLPGTPNWQGAKYPQLNDGSGLQVLQQSSDWPTKGQGRYAAINSLGADYCYAHMILSAAKASQYKALSEQRFDSGAQQRSLLKTIYIGGDKTIADKIVNDDNRRALGLEPIAKSVAQSISQPISKPISQSNSQPILQASPETVTVPSYQAEPSQMVAANGQAAKSQPEAFQQQLARLSQAEFQRAEATHLQYLQVEQRFYNRVASMLRGDAWGAAMSRNGVAQSNNLQPNTAQLTAAHGMTQPVAARPAAVPLEQLYNPSCLLNERQLVEITNGSVAKVLGPDYAEADTYAIRTRMPSPPYMFVSRITKLTAQPGKLEPCEIQWEYDLHPQDWFVYHGSVPAFVSLESSHAMIVAFTYIGCDQMFKGELRYRAIDSKTEIFSPMPKAGEVLKGRVQIHSFTKVGKNILINYEYDGYVGERHCFKLTATSGFFPLKDIEKSKNLDTKKLFASAQSNAAPAPILRCQKTQFSSGDIEAVQRGDLAACFGQGFGYAKVPGLYATQSKMLDRILQVDQTGGAWGLGQIIGERDIDPSHWAFKAHFKNDPVLPGTLIVEGAEQVLRFYSYYLGIHSLTHLKASLLKDHHYSAKFRGEVKCAVDKLRYRLSVKDFSVQKNTASDITEISLHVIAETLYRDKVIGICDNLGMRFTSGEE
ncbi:beta-ketoacyl synthase N-terminal-like domain-containing protein [Halioxenophilus aromaticivorans]|uniref:Ketosynthase family 3 (KS3) domain-containing protein n=1 Tax=Halioxenophilus aromaticivorans TaxID=1306992 RepID=A0AAV3U667_9ALTE